MHHDVVSMNTSQLGSLRQPVTTEFVCYSFASRQHAGRCGLLWMAEMVCMTGPFVYCTCKIKTRQGKAKHDRDRSGGQCISSAAGS